MDDAVGLAVPCSCLFLSGDRADGGYPNSTSAFVKQPVICTHTCTYSHTLEAMQLIRTYIHTTDVSHKENCFVCVNQIYAHTHIHTQHRFTSTATKARRKLFCVFSPSSCGSLVPVSMMDRDWINMMDIYDDRKYR